MRDRVLVLNMPPAMEDMVIDALLASEHCEGFTTSQVNGHSTHSTHYTITEQVTGRQKRIQIEILCDESGALGILDDLQQFTGAGIRYWSVPVLLEGQLV